MPNRRDILKQTCAVALGMTGPAYIARAANGASAPISPDNRGAAAIRSIVRRDETILRLGGVGDGYKMTWAADDRQFMVVNDGSGWVDEPRAFYNSRLWTIGGSVQDAAFSEVSGYPDSSDVALPETAPRYFGHGVLAVQGRLYQFLSTLDRATQRPRHWVGAKLIYSLDNGRTWCNQDGTSPVIWEGWDAQSRERLMFFQEPHGSFSLLSILQMGRDYSANRDGYIYVYGLNGNVDGRMNELVMFRVPTAQLLNRSAYEYFGGRLGTGGARWVKDIEARAIVHTFPRGWVNRTNLFPDDLVVESWLPSVVYNEPLGLYMMTSAGIGCAPDGTEFGKPSYLGFWVSATPWGPWRQIHEETSWTPGGDLAACAYAPQIAPKWIAADGKSLWLVWADLQGLRTFTRDRHLLDASMEKAASPEQRTAVMVDFMQRYLPRYACNAQRVDLTLS
jgi:hypothetical protein